MFGAYVDLRYGCPVRNHRRKEMAGCVVTSEAGENPALSRNGGSCPEHDESGRLGPARDNQTLEARAVRGGPIRRFPTCPPKPEDEILRGIGGCVKRFTSLAALAAFLFTATACGDDSSASPDTAAPELAIVSLSPTGTEMLFAIGAGDQVVAVEEYSNYPAEALEKPHDLSGFEPNVEAIAALDPDLVVMSDTKIQDQLESLGIDVWVGPAAVTIDDVYTQLEQLGAVTGHIGEAAELVGQMKADIEAAVATVAAAEVPSEALTYYHELDPTLYSLTSNTFAGQVYSLFGLTNIADGAQEGNDYPQLNAEYIIEADPALIFLADAKCCGESAEGVAARPGWDTIAAVANGGVITIDDDIASRWGPRIVDFVEAVAAAIVAVTAGV